METNNIICYQCKWGGMPGNVTKCQCPKVENPFIAIANAVIKEKCRYFAK